MPGIMIIWTEQDAILQRHINVDSMTSWFYFGTGAQLEAFTAEKEEH